MSLQIKLLGSVEIRKNGEPLKLPGFKPLALLAYLLITKKPHSRQHLVDLLFDEAADPRASLRWTLSHLRKAIGGDAVLSTRQQIEFNFGHEHQFDVADLLLGDYEVYRGELLPGIFLRDAHQFMEWLLFERESLRSTYQMALEKQLNACQAKRNISETAVIAQKLLLLDNLREEWHQALIGAYAQQGQREAALAQYNLCERILTQELGTALAPETVALVEGLQAEQLSQVTTAIVSGLPASEPISEAAVLPAPPFVSREEELKKLHGWLDEAIDGEGRVIFVTGMAGQGKTALLHAFARQALSAHSNLLVALGQGNAYAGIGDPYLPFQEVLSMLTGRAQSGFLSADHVRRLRENGPFALGQIVEFGIDLANIFVPASVLDAHVTSASAKGNGLQRVLPTSTDLPQTAVFQQYTNVLKAMAKNQPLLLLLDDLQWADTSSISLLFHLGRRLAHSRILIIGAYRPEEVALEENGRRHPLQAVLAEFKRIFGDVWLELGEASDEANQHFVVDYVNEEPNQLGQGFRRALFQHTGGHPLFTVELLRSMQERGDLILNSVGEWIEGPSLDWDRLPARVEAVISERIGRLESELKELLQVASVEGETFTAQVVANLQEMTERQLLRQLSQTLTQQHRLVLEQGELHINEQTLSRYRFVHTLIQRYLYQALSLAERRLLHREVGQLLERIYAEDSAEIGGQLARHFEEAGLRQKAIRYLQLAGKQAGQKHAYEEAIAFFSRALKLLSENGVTERVEILLAREKLFDIVSAREMQAADITELASIMESLPEDKKAWYLTELELRKANLANVTSKFQSAITAAQEALKMAGQTKNDRQKATAQNALGLALFRLGEFETAEAPLIEALTLSEREKIFDIHGDSLRILGLVARNSGRQRDGVNYFVQGLEFSQKLGDWIGEVHALNNIGITFKDMGQFMKAEKYLQDAKKIFQKRGNPHGEAQVLNNLGDLQRHLGNYDKARPYLLRAAELCQEMDEKFGKSIVLDNLARISFFLGDYEAGCDFAASSLALTKKIGSQVIEACALESLANCLQEMGESETAVTNYQKSMALRTEIKQFHMAAESQAGLARALFKKGDQQGAMANVDQILDFLKSGTVEGTEEPLRIYWICFQILLANKDERSAKILQEAYDQLQKQANKIEDPELRQSFLHNVPYHRAIIERYE